MGRTSLDEKLLGALLAPIQQRLLALLFGQPNRRFRSVQLLRLTRGGAGAAHRQLAALVDARLVRTRKVGHERYFWANQHSPVFAELRGLVTKTSGIAEPLRQALLPIAPEIRAAFVHHRMASEELDVIVISERMRHDTLRHTLARVANDLERPINPLVLTVEAWRGKRRWLAPGDKLLVLGSEADLD